MHDTDEDVVLTVEAAITAHTFKLARDAVEYEQANYDRLRDMEPQVRRKCRNPDQIAGQLRRLAARRLRDAQSHLHKLEAGRHRAAADAHGQQTRTPSVSQPRTGIRARGAGRPKVAHSTARRGGDSGDGSGGDSDPPPLAADHGGELAVSTKLHLWRHPQLGLVCPKTYKLLVQSRGQR